MTLKKISINDKILFFTVSALVIIIGTLIFILPQKNFSPSENRYLSKLKAPSIEKIISGDYARSISSFYTDQFPLRQGFTTAFSLCELSMGKREINSVIRSKNQLIARDKTTASSLPALPDNTAEIKIESKHALFSKNDKKLELYYSTDHHRTTKGAYIIYIEACEKLGLEPYEESFFKKEIVCDNFYGTAFFRSCLPQFIVLPDSIELWRYENDDSIEIIADGKKYEFDGFYDLSKLESSDKYSVFLGGNYARVSIKGDESKETLLIIKDSFANAVVPFLSLHFNIEMIDPRYMTKSEFQKNINSIKFDKALFLACDESFKG